MQQTALMNSLRDCSDDEKPGLEYAFFSLL